mgnify:CR=1 FL=1
MKITLISAFFDIGRANFTNTEYTRTNEKYFEYFKFWARMKNDLVVYTDSNSSKYVRDIRNSFGLKDKTTIIEINNIYSILPNIYEKMCKVSQSEEFKMFRYYENAMSNRASYDYVMLLKYWCMNDSVERGLADDMLAWMDFGFNHGGKCYTNAEDLQIVTLKNAIYMGMKNDLAFIMDMNLYLYEHQSTYNPNIPLRNLFYIADEYQRLVVQKSLYSTVIQKIPTPRFIVFYNGTKKVDDYNEFRLSSAYENPTDNPDLELRVTMLNVNDGHNLELMEHCRTLKEYAKYVARVRKYVTQNIPLEEAVTRAVDECIEEGILAEFLMKNKAEVIKVSIYEYDKEFEEEIVFQLVGSTEANSLEGKISNESPVGKALIGKKVGDVVAVETQAGVIEYEVLKINRSV